MSKKAFLTGITGQDGSYLAELLLGKGYEVHAIIRQSSVPTTQRIEHLLNEEMLTIYYGDLTAFSNIYSLLAKTKPDEIYNLGAQSDVAVSFDVPEYTADVVGMGALRLLEAIRNLDLNCKYHQASTSELFGGIPGTEPQNESTGFYPKSPYAASKLFAHWLTVNYRESYGIFACNGILFNHESARRGENFVTRKITRAVAGIVTGKQKVLKLGNLDAKRDWGHAKDYVYAQWLMLQQDKPQDYVIATGQSHTVREFATLAFKEVDIDIEWQGEGMDEKGINAETGQVLVEVDEKYLRPSEVEILIGDSTRAEKEIGWKRKVTFRELIAEMVRYDLQRCRTLQNGNF